MPSYTFQCNLKTSHGPKLNDIDPSRKCRYDAEGCEHTYEDGSPFL